MKDGKRKEKLDPPEATTGDSAYLLAKAVLSLIPGSTELFERFVTPPLQRRTQKWMEDVADALRHIEKEQGVVLETLQSDERFITIVLQASTAAIRSHQKEKLVALKNVILNSALGPVADEDLELIFVRFVEELTPSHLYLLKFFVDNEAEFISLKSYPQIYQLFIPKDTNAISQDEFKMLIGDLATRGLIWISQDIEDFEGVYQASKLILEETRDDLPRLIVTDIAKNFLKFISYSLGA